MRAQVATNHAVEALTLNISVDLSPVGASPVFVRLVRQMAARSAEVFPVSVHARGTGL